MLRLDWSNEGGNGMTHSYGIKKMCLVAIGMDWTILIPPKIMNFILWGRESME